MRIFLIALLAAISYAQTEENDVGRGNVGIRHTGKIKWANSHTISDTPTDDGCVLLAGECPQGYYQKDPTLKTSCQINGNTYHACKKCCEYDNIFFQASSGCQLFGETCVGAHRVWDWGKVCSVKMLMDAQITMIDADDWNMDFQWNGHTRKDVSSIPKTINKGDIFVTANPNNHKIFWLMCFTEIGQERIPTDGCTWERECKAMDTNYAPVFDLYSGAENWAKDYCGIWGIESQQCQYCCPILGHNLNDFSSKWTMAQNGWDFLDMTSPFAYIGTTDPRWSMWCNNAEKTDYCGNPYVYFDFFGKNKNHLALTVKMPSNGYISVTYTSSTKEGNDVNAEVEVYQGSNLISASADGTIKNHQVSKNDIIGFSSQVENMIVISEFTFSAGPTSFNQIYDQEDNQKYVDQHELIDQFEKGNNQKDKSHLSYNIMPTYSNQKCENTGNQEHAVSSKKDCEDEARSAHVDYYSYLALGNRCFYSTSCSQVISGLSRKWEIYGRASDTFQEGRLHHHHRHGHHGHKDHHEQQAFGSYNIVGLLTNSFMKYLFAFIGFITIIWKGLYIFKLKPQYDELVDAEM